MLIQMQRTPQKLLASSAAIAIIYGSPWIFTQAYANCVQTGGDVVCSADSTQSLSYTDIDSLTVQDGVNLTSTGNQVLRLNNGGSVDTNITIGSGARLSGASRSAIVSYGPINSLINNGELIGGSGLVGTALNVDGRAFESETNVINNGTIATTIVNDTRTAVRLYGHVNSTVSFTNNLSGVVDGTSMPTGWGIQFDDSSSQTLNNFGLIKGGAGAVRFADDTDAVLNNSGILQSTVGDQAGDITVHFSDGSDLSVNNGTIRSLNAANGRLAVSMYAGNDTFEIQSGSEIWSDATHTTAGIVDGGDDTDTLRFGGTTAQSFDLNTIDVDYLNFENFELREGQTNFSGTTTENFTIQNSATLSGTGVFGGLTFQSGSKAAPGNSIGTTTVDGDVSFDAGSTYEVEINPNGTSDLIDATGTATINGGTVSVLPEAGTYNAGTTSFTILSATGGVTGTFDSNTIDHNFAFLTPSLRYDANNVFLDIDKAASFSSFGRTNNHKSLGRALDNMDTTSGSEGEALTNLITGLTTSQAQQTYTDLAGEVHSSGSQNMFDVGGNVGDQVAGRFSNLAGSDSIGSGFGYSAAVQTLSNSSKQNYFSTDLATQNNTNTRSDQFGYGYTPVSGSDAELQFWGGVSGYYANSDGDGNAQGTNSSGYGLVLGLDRTQGDTTWGAALGYAQTTTQTDDDLSELDLDSYSAAIYAQTIMGDYNLNGLAAYTYHMIDGSRTISNIGATALSDYHAHQVTLQGEINRKFILDHNKDISPFLLGRYMNVSTSSYTETGAGAANLVSTGEDYWSYDLILGARLEVEVDDASKLTLGAGYSHRFGGVSPEATYAFSGGGTFTTEGVSRNRHSAYLEAGFEKDISDVAKFFVSASSNLTDTHQSIGGNIGLKVSF